MKYATQFLATMVICAAAASLALADGDSTARELFKDAFFQQTVEGDVDKAITLYRKGLEEKEIPAKWAATAYFQLGVCYEKQGETSQAIECYRKVIREYPGEEKNVADARKKLAGLGAVEPKQRSGYIAYIENLPVDRLDIRDKSVTRSYIKRTLGPPQFEHPRGFFLNYGGKYGLRFDMKGNRVERVCLFPTFPGEIEKVDAQGNASTLPPLTKEFFSNGIELRKARQKQYVAYLDSLPVDCLDISDKTVTRAYIKQKFGEPQYEHPGGLFLNYGAKYGLRFDMDGDRVKGVCLFGTFPGKVMVADDQWKPLEPFPLQADLVARRIRLMKKADNQAAGTGE